MINPAARLLLVLAPCASGYVASLSSPTASHSRATPMATLDGGHASVTDVDSFPGMARVQLQTLKEMNGVLGSTSSALREALGESSEMKVALEAAYSTVAERDAQLEAAAAEAKAAFAALTAANTFLEQLKVDVIAAQTSSQAQQETEVQAAEAALSTANIFLEQLKVDVIAAQTSSQAQQETEVQAAEARAQVDALEAQVRALEAQVEQANADAALARSSLNAAQDLSTPLAAQQHVVPLVVGKVTPRRRLGRAPPVQYSDYMSQNGLLRVL